MFLSCEKCGKKLVERLPNGLWHFKFGKNEKGAVVDIEIHGSMKITCIRRTCRHVNVFNYFPSPITLISDEKSNNINSKIGD